MKKYMYYLTMLQIVFKRPYFNIIGFLSNPV